MTIGRMSSQITIRGGMRLGDFIVLPSLMFDGLSCVMGSGGERTDSDCSGTPAALD